MRLLAGHDAAVAAFVADLAPIERPVWREPYWAFGVIRDDGALVGGVVFSEWRPAFGTIEMSAAGVSSLLFSPQIVSALGEHVYGKLVANRVWARTASSNQRAIKLLKHIGFTPEGVSADWYGPSQHAVTYRMLRRDWIRLYGKPDDQVAA